jgi:hypothetical protein
VNTKLPQDGDLRVWWIPQVPMKAFYVPVKDIHEAHLILDTLARYDIFQFENKVKPDYSNAGGLEIYESDYDGTGKPDWFEWENEDGENIDNVDDNGNTLEEEANET